MNNSQSSRIGSCKWHNCSCQSGEVGENINGQFYCANCGHQINNHYPTNDIFFTYRHLFRNSKANLGFITHYTIIYTGLLKISTVLQS